MTPRHRCVAAILARHGIHDGRMIASSKTGYCKRNPGHRAVFNAQVFTPTARILRQVDLDLTIDAAALEGAAREAGENLYVHYEDSGRSLAGTAIARRLIAQNAVWWTKIFPQDADVFLPPESGLRSRMADFAGGCRTGIWRGKPACFISSSFQSGINLLGAAVLALGKPPARIASTPSAEPFAFKPSPTRGRHIRAVFCQRSGMLEYVWFSSRVPVPAAMYCAALRGRSGVRFTCHQDRPMIHVWQDGDIVAFLWPSSILSWQVTDSAMAQFGAKQGP